MHSYIISITNHYNELLCITNSQDEWDYNTNSFPQGITNSQDEWDYNTNSFPQDITNLWKKYESFPQGNSYKPLQILRIIINLWKTICGKSLLSPIGNEWNLWKKSFPQVCIFYKFWVFIIFPPSRPYKSTAESVRLTIRCATS
jgi:hypothetical protein